VRKPLVAGIAFTVFLVGASGANKSLRDSAEERRVFANAHSNEAVHLRTAALADKTLVVETSQPDSNQCTVTLDVVAADLPFIQDAASHGFSSISCIAYNSDFGIVSSEIRKIVPIQSPVAPFKSKRGSRIAVA
jgi:hypothetical protein